jgi:shikimate dehydrogenase
LQVPADTLDVVMAGLTAVSNVDGMLVTMPHKHSAFAYCATISERAGRLGVVSVMRRNPDGTWHGDMLDGLAFVKAQKDHGARIEGARALLLGAGGAGSAIAVALFEAGIRELVIHDPNQARVTALIDLLSDHGAARAIAGPADPTGCNLVCSRGASHPRVRFRETSARLRHPRATHSGVHRDDARSDHDEAL